MSGIVGVWNLDGRPVAKELLDKMAATLAHRGPDGCFFWIQGPVGLACQLLKVTPESLSETQPAVGASGAVLVFDGRLDNREEILDGLPDRKVATGAPDSALILAAYEAYGENFPERLNGDFALAVFDPKRQQLLLARDSIGVRPLYYYQTGQTFLFASEIKALLAHPQRPQKPNDDLLAWYFLKQPVLDTNELTFFDGVSSLRPAHVALVTLQNMASRQYWDFDRGARIRLGSFEEYAEGFRQVFERAVSRRLRSAYPVAFTVSGGLDSSSIFCAAQRLKQRNGAGVPPLLGVSLVAGDGTPADEKPFVSAIEREYGVSLHRLPASLELLGDIAKPVWHTEFPAVSAMTNCTDGVMDCVRAGGARSLVTGHWGDQMLFDQSYLVALFRQFAWGKVSRHLEAYADWNPDVPAGVFRKQFARDLLRSYTPNWLLIRLRKYRHRLARPRNRVTFYTSAFRRRSRWAGFSHPVSRGFADAHASALYYTVRSGYYLLCADLDNKSASMYGMETSFPFLDRDVIAFLMAIPGEIQSWKGVPKGILRQAMKGVLPEAVEMRRGKGDSTDLLNDAMSGVRPRLLQLFEPTAMAIERGYVKPGVAEKLRQLRDPALEKDARLTFELCELFGLELWLRLFFGDDTSERELPKWA